MSKRLQKIIDNLLADLEPQVAEVFLSVMKDITDKAILSEIIKAIELGDIEAIFRAIGYSDAAMRPMVAELERIFETGGYATASTFPKRLQTPSGATVFRFDTRSSRAERFLRDQSSSLITRIGSDIRTNIQSTLNVGVNAGRNPRSIALDIIGRVNKATGRREGGVIGLTPQQDMFVKNARYELETLDPHYFTRGRRFKKSDNIVRRAIERGEKLDKETINRLIGRYNDSMLQLRGETIARTETVQSLNRAQYEAFKQAQDIGAIKKLTKTWDTSGDQRTRETHVEADGQTVDIDEPFIVGGESLMFPGDISMGASAEEIINCRCRPDFSVDWFEGVT